jgi:hypothetical protein
LSTVEQRRAGMIKTASGGYRGTLVSTERKRANFIAQEGLPNIPYFTFSEMQEFIRTNGGQWDGQSFCGTTEGYPDGNCFHNSLEQMQNSRAVSNTPLFIPKKADGQEWTPIQMKALAMQGIEVIRMASTDYTNFRGTKKFKKNVAYYTYSKLDPRNLDKYLREGTRISFADPQQKSILPPTQTPATPPMVTPAVSIAGTTAPPTPTPTPSRISVFPFVIIGILAIVFIIIWRGRK